MAVSNYDITSAAYRADQAHAYELSILTGMDSFAYILRDRTANRLLTYRSLRLTPAELDDWAATFNNLVLADERLRAPRYGTVVLGWQTERSVLVPSTLFDPADARAPLEHLTLVGLDDTVRHELFHELEAHLIFAAPRDRLEAVERRLNVRRTHHPAGGLLSVWSARSRRLGHQAVSVNLRGGSLYVAAHHNGRTLFANGFSYDNSQDALYYVALAYQQCGWLPSRVPLYLAGEITEESEVYRQFYRYVEDLRFCRYGAPPGLPVEFAGLPEHLYFDLLCLG